ncbi:MAG: hypothetical protein A3E07_00145 [Candidatus Wildermuthbacteria bacterium RIFCSPHIGHO2_12_FULL_45_9]|nr:MAG: hypothetical protein A2748_00720 [Candidatus Wildermuthbacteria bacterium RIFCSPHIGHO2_01_FULL_45_20]OHA70348.1 MAG: hypothetical protein A3E07_00145 [Candidatus Wildermuthbacteria bacterium RIFCSPHIGHO2_12_FULL_45_9]
MNIDRKIILLVGLLGVILILGGIFAFQSIQKKNRANDENRKIEFVDEQQYEQRINASVSDLVAAKGCPKDMNFYGVIDCNLKTESFLLEKDNKVFLKLANARYVIVDVAVNQPCMREPFSKQVYAAISCDLEVAADASADEYYLVKEHADLNLSNNEFRDAYLQKISMYNNILQNEEWGKTKDSYFSGPRIKFQQDWLSPLLGRT